MKFFSVAFRPAAFLSAGLLLANAAQAQRAGDAPGANDPFGKRTVAARAVPGGRYKSHAFITETQTVTGNVQNGPASESTQATLRIQATDGSTVQVRPWANGVVKVEYFAPGRSLRADSSVSVVQFPAAAPATAGAVTETSAALQLLLPDGVRVQVDKATLGVSILKDDNMLVGALSSAFRRQAAPPTAATDAEPGGTAVRFRLQPGEQLYGTGSRALPVDRRGHRLELYNEAHYAYQSGEPTLNVTLPVVLSSRGYLLFFDHYTAGTLDLGATDKDVLEYSGEGLSSLSYFVVTGKDQGEILNRYTALTGRQPLPPRWALGLIQSRFGYRSDTETENVAARMRREGFPLDALVHDLYWFGGITRQGDLEWDRRHFNDPVGMMKRLEQKGVKTVLISEPYVMRTSRNDSLVRTRGLVGTDDAGKPFTVKSFWAGPATILDMYKPSARAWLWSYYKKHHDTGVHGWWSDLGEPENHPEAMRHVLGPTRTVHNAFGMAWASILAENYAKEYPNERLFNLARSGWAGMQRNSVFPWSGDIQRSWSGFQAQVPIMLSMGMGGVGYMHSDAGGFCAGPIDSELYTRWLQMASLCPIMRPHGEGVPPEPFYYPEPYKSAVRDAAHLRYQLLPYLYTLAWQNTTTGAPLARMMEYDKQLSVNSYQLSGRSEKADSRTSLTTDNEQLTTASNDQYLLGPSLLVAPILQPGQRRRNVALPAGSWIDFYSGQTLAGGRTVSVPAPLARTPLLVKAGAFVPMTNYRPSTAQYQPDTLLLRYYPDPQVTESEFTMYDDDGHSAQALTRKQYETLTMRGFYSRTQTDVLLSSNGDYPGLPAFRLLRLLVQRVAAPPTLVLLDGKPTPAEAWSYNAERHELEVHFLMNAGTAVSMRGLRLLTQPVADAAPDALTLEVPENRSFGSGGTTLRYTRHAAGAATPLRIRSAQGQVVRELELNSAPGPHRLKWDGRDAQGQPLPLGVYTAEAGGQHQRLVVTE